MALRTPWLAASTLLFASACASSVSAQSTHLSYYAASTVIEGQRFYHVDVFANCVNECDRVLLMWSIGLGGNYNGLFQAEADVFPTTMIPLGHGPDPHWAVDSHLCIGGNDEMDSGGLALTTPDWEGALDDGDGVEPGCFFIIPPITQYNYAGPDRRVRLARITITQQQWTGNQGCTFFCRIATTSVADGLEIRDLSVSPAFSFAPSGDALNQIDIPSPEPYCYIETPGSGAGDGSAGGGGGGSGGGGSGEDVPPDGVPNPDPRSFDFDGDRTPNFFWHNATTGGTSVWEMDGLSRIDGGLTPWSTGTNMRPLGHGDIDDDSIPEAFFWNPSNRTVTAWTVVGDVRLRAEVTATLGIGWEAIDVGDFTGDGRADVLMRNGSSLRVQPYANGHAYVDWSIITLPAGYTYLCGVDGDGDGKLEIMARDAQGRHFLRRATAQGIAYFSLIATNLVSAPWRVAAVGDFDGDFDDDILWHNPVNGEVRGWTLQGGLKVGAALIRTGVTSQYTVLSTMDTDHDGDDDVFWRNEATGDVFGWKMNGLVRESGSFIRNVSLNWKIVNE